MGLKETVIHPRPGIWHLFRDDAKFGTFWYHCEQ